VATEKIDILVVDDEPAVGDALKRVLEANGYAVVIAETGLAGITQARRKRFHVGIIDLGLPDTSGLEVIKAVRELQSSMTVILTTAQSATAAQLSAQSLGPVELLLKPFRPEEILELIRKVLGG
jgi:DNA-binding response OmpR family regulator